MPMNELRTLLLRMIYVEFHLDRGAVAVLRVLDQENHQEGDDGRAGVDDELPGVGVRYTELSPDRFKDFWR